MIAYTDPYTTTGCSDPFRITYSTDSTLTGDNCRCPNCGCWHQHNQPSQTFYIPAQPREEPEESEDIKEMLRQWHRALSRQAAWEAQVALRGEGRDPRGKVPLQAQRRPYVRPLSKKRVCAGSSRYRVLVN